MSFDNRQFRINGPMQDVGSLGMALEMACRLESGIDRFATAKVREIVGWTVSRKSGLVLFCYIPDGNSTINRLPAPLNHREAMAGIVVPYLRSEQSKDVELQGWDKNADHDGSNIDGWLVYLDDWGHIGDCCTGVVCGIKRVFLWLGK